MCLIDVTKRKPVDGVYSSYISGEAGPGFGNVNIRRLPRRRCDALGVAGSSVELLAINHCSSLNGSGSAAALERSVISWPELCAHACGSTALLRRAAPPPVGAANPAFIRSLRVNSAGTSKTLLPSTRLDRVGFLFLSPDHELPDPQSSSRPPQRSIQLLSTLRCTAQRARQYTLRPFEL